MSRTTIQIPVDTTLRNEAQKAAEAAGFSSIQEVVRIFLKKFSQQSVSVGFFEKDITLSKEAEKRYSAMINDAKAGRNIYESKDKKEFFEMLKS